MTPPDRCCGLGYLGAVSSTIAGGTSEIQRNIMAQRPAPAARLAGESRPTPLPSALTAGRVPIGPRLRDGVAF